MISHMFKKKLRQLLTERKTSYRSIFHSNQYYVFYFIFPPQKSTQSIKLPIAYISQQLTFSNPFYNKNCIKPALSTSATTIAAAHPVIIGINGRNTKNFHSSILNSMNLKTIVVVLVYVFPVITSIPIVRSTQQHACEKSMLAQTQELEFVEEKNIIWFWEPNF